MKTKLHIAVLIVTLVFLVGGLTSYTLIKNGYFPVAKVNGQIISYKTVIENVDVSRRLYSQGLAGSSAQLDQLFLRNNSPELIKNSLENLITNAIIKKSASAEVLTKASQEVEANFKDAAGLANSVKSIYGWDVATFRERILEPQALFQVLGQEKGRGFENWVQAEKNKAGVSVWFLPYKWEKGQLNSK